MGRVMKPPSIVQSEKEQEQRSINNAPFSLEKDFVPSNNTAPLLLEEAFVPSNNNVPFPLEDFLPLESSEIDRLIAMKRKKPPVSSSSSDSSASSDNDEEEAHVGVAPWKTTAYPDNAFGLHMEILDFVEYIAPLPEERNMRRDVVSRLTGVIKELWPRAKVDVFGSYRTKLYLPTSDIDLVVFGRWKHLPLFTLERALIKAGIVTSSDIKVLDKAAVPIIKLKDIESQVSVDISFNVESAVIAAELIKEYTSSMPVVRYLFAIVKQFLVQRDLNEVFTGGVSSYCLLLLIISFLQRHARADVRSEARSVNLGVLLLEFFELYGRNFNYEQIAIRIRDGGRYICKHTLMDEHGNGNTPALLSIEDPVTAGNDVGRGSYGMIRVKEAFEYAFNVLGAALRNHNYFKNNLDSTYLSRIINVPNTVLQYRKWVQKSYATVDLHITTYAPPDDPTAFVGPLPIELVFSAQTTAICAVPPRDPSEDIVRVPPARRKPRRGKPRQSQNSSHDGKTFPLSVIISGSPDGNAATKSLNRSRSMGSLVVTDPVTIEAAVPATNTKKAVKKGQRNKSVKSAKAELDSSPAPSESVASSVKTR